MLKVYTKMDKKIKVKKPIFCQNKKSVPINNVDINKIVVSNKVLSVK